MPGAKLMKEMDAYYGYKPGTIQNIKSKPVSDSDLQDVDDGTKQYEEGMKIFKIFNDVKYKGPVTVYDPKKKLYHVIHEDTIKRHPKKQRWKS